MASLIEYIGTWDIKRAAHLLRRATFGTTKDVIDNLVALGNAGDAVDQLYTQTTNPFNHEPTDSAGNLVYTDETAFTNSELNNLEERAVFRNWMIGKMYHDTTGLEKLTFFLHTFFTNKMDKTNGISSYWQSQLFRVYAFDTDSSDITLNPTYAGHNFNFKELIQKVCLDNAMVRFLDTNQNFIGNLNENFCRELLELYSIGKGRANDPNLVGLASEDYFYFKEEDIEEGAKIFTGIRQLNGTEYFDPDNRDLVTDIPHAIPRNNTSHDNDSKTLSNRLGNTSITPTYDPTDTSPTAVTLFESIEDEIRQFVDAIYNNTEAAKYLCRKLYRFYVYGKINEDVILGDDIEADIITPLANDFLTTHNFSIQETVKQLLKSEHFYETIGSLIKSPLDYVLGSLKTFNFTFPDYTTDNEMYIEKANEVLSLVERTMDFNYYIPFEVAGYSAYHQYPLYDRNWISPNILANRYDFFRSSLLNTMSGFYVDTLLYIENNFNAFGTDPNLLKEIAQYIFPLFDETTEVTTERFNYFYQDVFVSTSEDITVGFWNFNWNNLKDHADPAVQETSRTDMRGVLDTTFNSMLQSPEYMLM